MKIIIHIILFVIIIPIFIGCQSTVRFSSKSNSNKCDIENESTSIAEKNYYNYSDLNDIRKEVIKNAEDWLGTPYRWGGEKKSGADCSGFVQSVFYESGIKLPRTSRQQYKKAVKISQITAQAGDLVFFSNGSRISHVGIYLGNNQMIHSSSTYGVIKQSLNKKYYKNRLAGFGKVIS